MILLKDPNKWQIEGVLKSRDLIHYFLKDHPLKLDGKALISWMPIWTESWGQKRKLQKKNFFHRNYFVGEDQNPSWFYNLGMGSPMAAMLIEDLKTLGAKSILSLGLCGSLSSKHKAGDILLVKSALRGEGTSRHYWPESEPLIASDENLSHRVQDILSKNGLKFKFTQAWTTDALYKETEAEINQALSLGIEVVDMEASALYAVGKNLKLPTLSIFVVSDHLLDGVWMPGFREPEVKNKYMKLLSVLFDELVIS